MTKEKRIKTYLHINSKTFYLMKIIINVKQNKIILGEGRNYLSHKTYIKVFLPSYTNVPINQQKKNSQKREKNEKRI